MGKVPFKVSDIKSYSPAIETRNSSEVFLLRGKNFAFDSKGPKSDFGSRLVANGFQIERANGLVQNIEVAGRSFTATFNGIWELSPNTRQWVRLIDFSTYPRYLEAYDQRWTSAYLASGIYLCHPSYGLFKIGVKQVRRLTRDEIPGLPIRPYAVAESNGRLGILNMTHITWSAPADGDNFIPELGGAGQQLLSERCSGSPMTLVGMPNGFTIWTTTDCLVAEFIGGDLVWRWIRSTTKQIPISGSAVEELTNSSHLICTKQGLYVMANGREPEILTPTFNEFIREVIARSRFLKIRLTYSINEDRVFVQIRDSTSGYVKTYVLSVSLDKWGEFSESNMGILRWSNRRLTSGYVDMKGRAHQFMFDFQREVEPGMYTGLDSWIEIGQIVPDGAPEGDTLFEIQELLIGVKQRPSWSIPEEEDMGIVGTPVTSLIDDGFIGQAIDEVEDDNGPHSLLNHTTYKVSVASDLDGQYDEIVTIPELAVEEVSTNLWTLLTSGAYHRVRISATEIGERYHVQTLSGTFYYQGQLS